jgi:adenylyltransferase/sulfurtransferase
VDGECLAESDQLPLFSLTQPMETDAIPPEFERYSRQIRFWPIGLDGQRKLSDSTAVVIGCGALGSVIAETLVRSGVGRVRLVDRDFPEIHNLQRQVLYTEADVQGGLPKAIAASRHLAEINSSVVVEPLVTDVDHTNIATVTEGAGVIVDGTDNFETRFLVNDWSVESGCPWVYGGCLGSEGQTMTILPGESACLNCLMSDGPPPPGTTPGCDTAGIVAPVANIIASLEAMEAIKILSGNRAAVTHGLTIVDLWSGQIRKIELDSLPQRTHCEVCQGGRRDWLSGKHATQSAILCGRNAVQIRGRSRDINLEELAQRLQGSGRVVVNPYLLRFDMPERTITVFADGRAIITGTDDIARARSLYAQWIGA